MSEIINTCPTPETIIKYFFRELDRADTKRIEEHFSLCDQCIEGYDYYSAFAQQISLSAKVQKEFWQNANIDTFFVAAADSYDNGISELKSSDGKYILQKIPYLDDDHISLLVVKLAESQIRGKLSLYHLNETGPVLIGSAQIDDESKVCFDVESDIELKKLLVVVI